MEKTSRVSCNKELLVCKGVALLVSKFGASYSHRTATGMEEAAFLDPPCVQLGPVDSEKVSLWICGEVTYVSARVQGG